MPNTDIDTILEQIAKKTLNHTLQTRNSDSDDFMDVAVWQLKEAMRQAFEAGRKLGQQQ